MQRQKYHINQPSIGGLVVGPPRLPKQGLGTPVQVKPRIGAVHPLGYCTRVKDGLSYLVIKDTRAREEYVLFRKLFRNHYGNVIPAPGLEAIGCGFDVFGDYACAASLKRRLFDIGKLGPLTQTTIGNQTYNHWPIVTVHPLSQSECRVIVGSNFMEYTESLSASGGMGGGFKGFHAQAEVEFSTSQTQSRYSAFTNVIDVTRVFAMHLMDMNNLRDFLAPDVLVAIDNADGSWSPERLFDEFGLYFLTGAIIGGRLNHWSVVDTFYLRTDMDLAAMAEADFLGLIGGSSDLHSSSSFTAYQSHSVSETTTEGGKQSLGGESITDQASYQHWKDTIPEEPYFIEFTRPTTKKPLTPIWNLAVGPRRGELEAAAPAYISNIVAQFEARHVIDMTRRVLTYWVTTHTGSGDADGTPGNIYVKLRGRDRFGNVYESQKLHHKVSGGRHRKGAVNPVRFALPDLGELVEITVSHENVGDPNGWGVHLIEVLCEQNGKKCCASCYTWLSGNSATFSLYPA